VRNLPVSQFRLLEQRLKKWTKIGTVVLGAMLVLLGGGALYNRTAAAQTNVSLALVQKQLSEASWRLKEAGNHPQFPSRSAYAAIRDFQKELDRIALYRGCAITAFQVAGDPNPFTTVFGKEKPDSTWTQGSVRFELTGKSLDAINALRQIGSCGVPVEFDSLEIRRGKVGPDGSELIAIGSLRVIGELPGGKTL